MKKRYVFIIVAVLLFACKEAYNPPYVSPSTGYLVVDGFINSGNGVSSITLSRTTKLVDTIATLYEEGAQVNIEDENGATYPLYAGGNGNYTSENLSLTPTVKYRIHIQTRDGKEYLSDFTAVKQTPPIDGITWKMENGGLQLYVNSHDPSASSKYYQLKYSETWEFQSAYIKRLEYVIDPTTNQIIGVTPLPNADTSIFKCWKTQNPSNILLVSTEKLRENKVYFPIRYIEPFGEELSVRYYIEVKQYALSREAYLFKQKLKKNTEQLGTIFDPQPSELGGNVHCMSDPAETVVGFVDVTSEAVAKQFITPSDLVGWPLRNNCVQLVVENEPGNYDPALVPTSAIEYRGLSIKSFFAADPYCVDCTLRGSNIKPSFWP